jgi:MbtH protein
MSTQENPSPEDGWDWQVLVNDEEQHSLWPAHREVPAGWRRVGPIGAKQTCLDHIEANWTDLRPASLRRAMRADSQ